MLKQSGHLGFIVPNTLLNNDDFEELRKQILEKCHLRKLNILGDGVFEGATVSTIVIILQKSKVNKDKITDVVVGKDVFSKKIIKVRQHDFYKNEKVRFNIKSEESQKIIDKCNKNSSRFEDVVDYISGIQVWQNETDRIKHPELLSKKKLNEKYKKTIIGENISKYNLKFNEDYVLYDKNLLERARDEKYFTKKEKLLMRYIGTKLICSYDNQQYYAQKSVIVLFPKNESHIPIKYLLSLINSNLFQFLYDKNVGDEPYPRINISYLLSLPIKKISLDIQQKISDVVETIISLNKKLNEIDDRNTPEKEKLQKEIQKLDKEIDELVYKIYGITEEEQKIIEESLKQ